MTSPIAAEGEALAAGELGRASDTTMAQPLALQLRNLHAMVEIGVDKNSTIVFPAPLMSTIQELGAFLARETAAARPEAPVTPDATNANGTPIPAYAKFARADGIESKVELRLALRPTIPARERFYADTCPARRGNAPLRQRDRLRGRSRISG
jgi:hypothetical protein